MQSHFVSLGHDCATDASLQEMLRKIPHYPFDHGSMPRLSSLIPHFLNRFEYFLESSYPDVDVPPFENGCQPTEKSGVRFRHHAYSVNHPDPSERCNNTASMGRRIIRLLNTLYSGSEVWLVRNCPEDAMEEDSAVAKEHLAAICATYRNPRIGFILCTVERGTVHGHWQNYPRWKSLFTQWGFLNTEADGMLISLHPDDPGGVTVNTVRPSQHLGHRPLDSGEFRGVVVP